MRRRALRIFAPEPEADPRPSGSVQFADPCTASLTEHVHTFNDPHSKSSVGEQSGFRSYTGPLVPFGDRTGQTTTRDAWQNMNRKRGVSDGEDD